MNYVNLCGIPNRSIRITYRPLPLPFLLQDYRGAPILQSFLRCIKYLVSVWRKSSSDYVPGTAWAPLGRAWAISPKIHLLVDSHMCASIEAPRSLYTGRDEREIHILSEGDNILSLLPCLNLKEKHHRVHVRSRS